MDERKSFIEDWHKRKHSFAELCRAYAIARKTGYKWVERFKAAGWEGLQDSSRAPHNCPQAISERVSEQIVSLRQEHPTWGARKLRERLKDTIGQERVPAASSIHEVLEAAGLIVHRRKRRKTPPCTVPLQEVEAANQAWSADFKGWFRCGDGTRCDPLTIADVHSRYLLRCRHLDKTDGIHARAVFEAVFREHGLPDRMRTDNGPPFASPAPGGLSRLSIWWIQLGIEPERIELGRPDQNGRHERMHRTLKAETANPPEPNLRQQQHRFERFTQQFNYERPHEALGYRTPAEIYVRSNREFPSRIAELAYPDDMHVRRISQQGSLKWKSERTFVSEVLARETVGLRETDDHLYEVYYGPLLIGWLDGTEHVFVAQKRPPKSYWRRSESETDPQE